MSRFTIILALVLSFFFGVFQTHASEVQLSKVSCSQYGGIANGCDTCFEKVPVYTGDVKTVSDVFEAGNKGWIYYLDENPREYSFTPLNSNTTWFTSNNLIRYPDSLPRYEGANDRVYSYFPANSNTRFLETVPGKGIQLVSVADDNVNPNTPAYRFTFTSKAREVFGIGDFGSLQTHNECVFFVPRYCGDGIVQTDKGETCDPNGPVGDHGNGGCDTNTCQPINNPTCEGVTVDRTTGQGPTDVVTTCTGFKVDTYRLDCGNGQVFTGNGNNAGTQTFSHTCNYTDGDTYMPQCFINDTITSNSCKKTVDITNLPASIQVDKRDANVFDLDDNVGNDVQEVRSGEDAVFKIRVTNNGTDALRNIQLTDPVEDSCATAIGGQVNLTQKRFRTRAGNFVGISFGGAGNNNNNVLEPNEWFEYTCTRSDTQSDYTNTVGVSGVGVTSGETKTDEDDTQVVLVPGTPDISVIKRDANNNDLDSNIGGNDSQTVALGDRAVFRIIVTNSGTEDLENIRLNDELASACSTRGNTTVNLAANTFTNGDNVTLDIAVSGAGNHNDDIFQVGERFAYSCASPNTTESYTNIVEVQGTGVVTGDDVSDDNPTEVVLVTDPKIEVVKEDENSNDQDDEQFNDTQTVITGEDAVFHITVRNIGDEDLQDIRLTDELAQACATNADTTVDLAAASFVNGLGNSIDITYLTSSAGDHSDAVLQVGEEFSYTCTSENTQTEYVNTVEVSGVGVISGRPDSDDDTSIVNIMDAVFDLALRKTLSSSTPGPFESGDTVSFDIEVFNQGNTDATNIVVTDYIPSGLTLRSTNTWTLSGDTASVEIGSIAQNTSKIRTISFTIDAGITGSITNFAEISAAEGGQDCDSTPDSDNGNTSGEQDGNIINDEIGGQCDPRDDGDEDDHDLEEIMLGNYDLALTKQLSTSEMITTGDTIEFSIIVTNQGDVDSGSVEVTDYIPAGLSLVTGNGWAEVAGNAVQTIVNIPAGDTRVLPIEFTIDADAQSPITNFAEISSDSGQDCDSTPDSDNGNTSGEQDGNIINDEIGGQCDPRDDGDEDDHDLEEITFDDPIFDLALTKTLSEATPGPFNVGDRVVYDITVYNQGNVDAADVEITDYIPEGFTLRNRNAWDATGNRATRIISSIPANADPVVVRIAFTITQDAQETTVNFAEISEDNADDCDSLADGINRNQDGETGATGMINDDIGTGCDEGGDQDDHDFERITIGEDTGVASIQIDKTDANDADQDNEVADTQTVDRGDDAVFQITVTNDGNINLTNVVIADDEGPACVRTASQTTTLIRGVGNNDAIFDVNESFSYECSVPNTPGDYTNVASVTADPVDTTLPEVSNSDESFVDVPGGGSPRNPGNGGPGPYTCTNLDYIVSTQTGALDTVRCEGNSTVRAFYLKCGGNTLDPVDALRNGGQRYAEFECTSDTVQCYVHDERAGVIEGKAWRTSNQCRVENTGGNPNTPDLPGGPGNPGPQPSCGNGIVQADKGEQCDFGTGKNGPGEPNQAYCGNSGANACKIVLPPIDPIACANSGTDKNKLCVLTFPDEGKIVFTPGGHKIIGHGQNPVTTKPSIENRTSYDLKFDQFCIQENDASAPASLITGDRQCSRASKSNDGVLYPYEIVEFTYIPTFTANKNAIPANADYAETKLSTSLYTDMNDDGSLDDLKNAYFAANMKVRVARPAVATVGGGTSYVKNTSTTKTTGDIAKVTENFDGVDTQKNKNFVGTSISGDSDGTSSFTETLDTSSTQGVKVVEDVVEANTEFKTNVNKVSDVEVSNNIPTTPVTGFLTNYNGLGNVYVVSGKNVNVNSMSDLTIDGPTTFIVEGGGDLYINDDIITDQNIAFVVRGGNIIIDKDVEELSGTYISIPVGGQGGSIESQSSGKQLVVNGSLYGDIQDLVQNRNYISQDGDQLSVGTVVSFGSSIFHKPAPLVSQFVGEYLDSEKVAR